MISINNEKSSSYHLLFLLLLLSFPPAPPSSYFFSLLNYLRICWLTGKVPYHLTDTSPSLRTTLFSPFVKQSDAPATPTEYFNEALSLWNCRSCDVLLLHIRAHRATRKPQASNVRYYSSPKNMKSKHFQKQQQSLNFSRKVKSSGA